MNTRNCVISAVGKNSLHKMWIKEHGDFDLHLIVYDDSLELFRNDTKYICHIKGYKLKIIYKYLEAHSQFKEMYDYFFFPDDDVLMDTNTINELFSAMRHYNLCIAQPALKMSYYSWSHTLYDRYSKLRYTNFVEMMVPCFSRNALQKVLFTFNENETGWGTESHWPILINAKPCDMAIIDEVSVIHTRPLQSGQENHFKDLKAYMQKYRLETKVECYDVIKAPEEGAYCCDASTYAAIRSAILHWIHSEGISSMHIGEDGYCGYVHLLFLLANLTQSQKYADAALELLGRIQDGLGLIKDDMTFLHGITGCCWLVEFFAGEKLLQENPQELLIDVDTHILMYLKNNTDRLTFAELVGIGKYSLAKFHNRPDFANKRILENLAQLISSKQKLQQSFNGIIISIDAMEIQKECGTDISGIAHSLEIQIYKINLSPVELIYCIFRLYLITYDEHLFIRVREGLRNLVPRLMNLADALMLAEILYYKQNHKTK